MTVKKQAQNIDSNYAYDDSNYSDIVVTDSNYDMDGEEEDSFSYDGHQESYAADDKKDKDDEPEVEADDDIVVLEVGGDDDAGKIIEFMMPDVPGAPNAVEIEDDEVVEVDADPEEKEIDAFDWQSRGLGNFVPWLQGMVNNTPGHSGYDVGGLERAISFFEYLLKEITKANRMDFKGEIDIAACEDARSKLEDGIERMLSRLERVKVQKFPRYKKTKKASWYEDSHDEMTKHSSTEMVKEAQKATNITGVTLVVPLFISRLARVLVNGMVSAGHSMEDMYDDMKGEYDLTKREECELNQLLADMGYPMRQDRGFAPGTQVDSYKSDNRDWAANYNG